MNVTELTRTSRRALVLAAMLTFAPAARADEPTVDGAPSASAIAEAQVLFTEGRRLVTEGRYAEACAKLAESQRLDPSAGAQLNLADCYERNGQTASAWTVFREAAVAAQRTGRASWAEQALERARILEPNVATLTIVVDDVSPGLEVSKNAARVSPSAFASPIPSDPGAYVVEASAPHHRPWSTRVVVDATTPHLVVHVPALAPVLEEASRPLAESAPIAPVANARIGNAQRTGAIVAGVAGIASIAAGGYFGLVAMSQNDAAARKCPASPRCADPDGLRLTDDAHRAANASTITFLAGGGLLIAATALYFTAPKADTRAGSLAPRFSASLGPSGWGAVVSGGF